MSETGCHICQLGASATDAQIVYRDEGWTAASPIPVPGWVMLFPNRHDEGVWELTDAEAEQFGRLAVRLAKVLKQVCEPECVYIMYAGENALHSHVMVMARGADIPKDWRGGALVGKHAELVNTEEADRVLEAVREAKGLLVP